MKHFRTPGVSLGGVTRIPRTPAGPAMTEPLVARLRSDLPAAGSEPLSLRLADRIWAGVVEGEIESGARLPTVRELAVALGTSPRTVERAYERLEQLGVVHPRLGEGTFVSLAPPPEEEHRRQQALRALAREAVEEARALGFEPDDLVDAVADWRSTEP